MRKILLLVCLVASMFVLSAGSVLAISDFYVGMADGALSSEGSVDSDVSLSVFGADYFAERYKVCFSYFTGDVGSDGELSSYELKGGYLLLTKDALKVYGTLAYTNQEGEIGILKTSSDSFLAGADVEYFLPPNMILGAFVQFSLSASAESQISGTTYAADDVSNLNYGVSFSYIFNKNISAALSYRSLNSDVDGNESTLSGFILGVAYVF